MLRGLEGVHMGKHEPSGAVEDRKRARTSMPRKTHSLWPSRRIHNRTCKVAGTLALPVKG